MSLPSEPSGEADKPEEAQRLPSRDDLVVLSENAGRRATAYVEDLFRKSIAAKFEPKGQP